MPFAESGDMQDTLMQSKCPKAPMHGFMRFTFRCDICNASEESGYDVKPDPVIAKRQDKAFIELHQRCAL